MKKLISLLFCGGVGISAPVIAEPESGMANDIHVSQPSAGMQGFYLGATLGLANYDMMDDSDIAFDLFAGFNINEILSIELGWVNFGEIENAATTLETSAFHAAMIGSLSLQSDLNLYAKLGMTRWDADLTVGAVSVSDSGADVFFGGGIDYQVAANTSVRFSGDWYVLGDEDVAVYSVGVKQSF